MHVYLHISCAGVTSENNNVAMETPEGATVNQVLEEYARQYNAPFLSKRLDKFIILVNDSPTKHNHILKNNDTLTVLRPLFGWQIMQINRPRYV